MGKNATSVTSPYGLAYVEDPSGKPKFLRQHPVSGLVQYFRESFPDQSPAYEESRDQIWQPDEGYSIFISIKDFSLSMISSVEQDESCAARRVTKRFLQSDNGDLSSFSSSSIRIFQSSFDSHSKVSVRIRAQDTDYDESTSVAYYQLHAFPSYGASSSEVIFFDAILPPDEFDEFLLNLSRATLDLVRIEFFPSLTNGLYYQADVFEPSSHPTYMILPDRKQIEGAGDIPERITDSTRPSFSPWKYEIIHKITMGSK